MIAQENMKSQMKKGVLELCILSTLQHQELYASDIISILRQSQIVVPEATLYPILTRLKNADFLSFRWVESSEGPPRKYFFITNSGKIYHQQMKAEWIEFETAVNQLIQ